MKVTFTRHGQTDLNSKQISIGQIDVPLNPEGFKQAKELAGALSSDFDVVFSSTLLRARQTAEILNEKLNVYMDTSSDIVERDTGELDGIYWSEIEAQTGISKDPKFQELETDFSLYGGESVEEVRDRVNRFLQMLRLRYYDKKVLVVSHAGIIRVMYAMYDPQGYKDINHCTLHEFSI